MSDHSIWLRREPRPGVSNDGTAFLGFDLPARVSAPPFRDSFHRAHAAIRDRLSDHGEPGLGLFVTSAEGLEASAWVGAKQDAISALIIGRHSAAGLYLPSDPLLSLRHLAVILYRCQNQSAVRFRILDLRTPTAFWDEEGARLEAIEAQGPLMLRCASYSVLLFPTGGQQAPWLEDAEVAWESIPKRVYIERASADPARWGAPGLRMGHLDAAAVDAGARTLVSTFPGPVFVSRDLGDRDVPRGEIVIAGRTSLRLSVNAARQGVLLGRYPRCDTAGLPGLSDGVSRVHLLFVELGGTLYAVDTASTNGSWLGAERVQVTRVESGLHLRLADVDVEWRSFH